MKSKNSLLTLTYEYENLKYREQLYNETRRTIKERFGLIDADSKYSGNNKHSQMIKQDGFCHLGHLDKKICRHLIDKYYMSEQGAEENNANKSSVKMDKLCRDSVVLQIYTKNKIIRPIENYLGIMPTIQSITSWQNIGQKTISRENEMYWHMDHHGHRFIKVFFYLTDVKYGHGHHQYVKQTHMQKKFDDELRNRTDLYHLKREVAKKRELRGSYKIEDDALWPLADRIENVTGSAGAGFMEDTRGLHRGTILPTNEKRIVLQALMLPFDSGKDKNVPKRMKRSLYNQIKAENKYSDQEMNKLLYNLEIIEDC